MAICTRMERNLDDSVRDMAMQGIFPKGNDANTFAKTAKLYCLGLGGLLGLMQEAMLQENPEKLVDLNDHN